MNLINKYSNRSEVSQEFILEGLLIWWLIKRHKNNKKAKKIEENIEKAENLTELAKTELAKLKELYHSTERVKTESKFKANLFGKVFLLDGKELKSENEILNALKQVGELPSLFDNFHRTVTKKIVQSAKKDAAQIKANDSAPNVHFIDSNINVFKGSLFTKEINGEKVFSDFINKNKIHAYATDTFLGNQQLGFSFI